MKILVLVSGEKKFGNTTRIVESFLTGFKESNHEIELINLSQVQINACMDCNACVHLQDKFCIQNDAINELFKKLIKSDYVVFASPLYFNFFSGTMKLFIDRFHAIGKKYEYNYPKKKYVILVSSAGDDNSFNLLRTFADSIFTDHMGWEEVAFCGIPFCSYEDDFSKKKKELKEIEKIGKEIEGNLWKK